MANPVRDAQHFNLFGVAELSANRSYRCVLLDTGGIKCWGRNDFGAIGDTTSLNQKRAKSVLVGPDADSDPFHVGKGPGRSAYNCRSGHSRCFLRGIVLQPGAGQSNPNGNSNPVIDVLGLGESETLTLYSDSSCQTSLANGVLTGNGNTQTITLSNSDTSNVISIYYKLSGDTTNESNVCFDSFLVLDRVVPDNPTATYTVSPKEITGSPPNINVARDITVSIMGGDLGATYIVYRNDSSCSGPPIISKRGGINPEYSITIMETATSYQETMQTTIVDSIHVKIKGRTGNQSECTAATSLVRK